MYNNFLTTLAANEADHAIPAVGTICCVPELYTILIHVCLHSINISEDTVSRFLWFQVLGFSIYSEFKLIFNFHNDFQQAFACVIHECINHLFIWVMTWIQNSSRYNNHFLIPHSLAYKDFFSESTVNTKYQRHIALVK